MIIILCFKPFTFFKLIHSNFRYLLYDILEKRLPKRGPGYPIAEIGRKEVRGTFPGIFLPEIFDRSQYHQLGYHYTVSALPDPDDLRTPLIGSARAHPVPRLQDRTLSHSSSIIRHVHNEHAPLNLTSHG
jgi:hypothetical protein